MAPEYIIQSDREDEWLQGQAVSLSLLDITQYSAGVRYYPVHGDPILSQLDDHDLLCYFIYTLSSWWEIPLIDRINDDREDNNFAIQAATGNRKIPQMRTMLISSAAP